MAIPASGRRGEPDRSPETLKGVPSHRPGVPDLDSALLSVEERNNWRRRAELLRASLEEIRSARRALERRLSQVKREIGRLRDYPGRLPEAHLSSEHAAWSPPFGR